MREPIHDVEQQQASEDASRESGDALPPETTAETPVSAQFSGEHLGVDDHTDVA